MVFILSEYVRTGLSEISKSVRDEFVDNAIRDALKKRADLMQASMEDAPAPPGAKQASETPAPPAPEPEAAPADENFEFRDDEPPTPSAVAASLRAMQPEPPPPPPPPAPVAHTGSVPEIELVNQGTHYLVRFFPNNVRKLYRLDSPVEGGAPVPRLIKELGPDVQIPRDSIIRGTIPDGSAPAPAPAPKAAAPARMTFPFEIKNADGRFKILSFGGKITLNQLHTDATGKAAFRPVRDLSKQEAAGFWNQRIQA